MATDGKAAAPATAAAAPAAATPAAAAAAAKPNPSDAEIVKELKAALEAKGIVSPPAF